VVVNVDKVEPTAEILCRVNPDIVFSTVTRQSWRVITELPKQVFERLDEAQFGPWLPMHLAPVHSLMSAVRAAGLTAPVVNAAFPDAVNPTLATLGLAPTVGIGNVANVIPALRSAVAAFLSEPVADVRITLFTQHFFSHRVPRFGDAGGAPFDLRASVRGQSVTHLLDFDRVLHLVSTRFRRQGGVPGQLLTAASAMSVLSAMLRGSGEVTHAPGPNGLPGGYAVRVSESRVDVALPSGLSLDEAVRINAECQRFDGIERIDADGTVTFTEPEMAIMKEVLGYSCRRMHITESGGYAEELRAKYLELAERTGG
jgi:hypothetical protein